MRYQSHQWPGHPHGDLDRRGVSSRDSRSPTQHSFAEGGRSTQLCASSHETATDTSSHWCVGSLRTNVSHRGLGGVDCTSSSVASSLSSQSAPLRAPAQGCAPCAAMPMAAALADTQSLLECVAFIELNLDNDGPSDPVTAFHSSAVPPISLAKFCFRIVYHSGYGADGIAVALALMGRYSRAAGQAPTPLTCHRLLLASIVVGMKAMSDRFVQNALMAPIVGVPLHELNRLEAALLQALEFSAIASARELVEIAPRLLTLREAQDACYDPRALYRALTCCAPAIVPCRGLPVSPRWNRGLSAGSSRRGSNSTASYRAPQRTPSFTSTATPTPSTASVSPANPGDHMPPHV